MKIGYQALVREAAAQVKSYDAAALQERMHAPGALLVDVREAAERTRDGVIPGAFHAPRGLLEFWIDPESPYFKPVFGQKNEFIFFCAAGWRSALAAKTAQDMGLAPVAHLDGGFAAWQAAGAPVDALPQARP